MKSAEQLLKESLKLHFGSVHPGKGKVYLKLLQDCLDLGVVTEDDLPRFEQKMIDGRLKY